MAAIKKPARSWSIDDLLHVGSKTGATYLKAVPVLILESWVQGERKEGEANFVRTKDLAKRLESSGVGAGFDPGSTRNITGALTKIQRGRNLTDPPLIEFDAAGIHRINLPHYEPLLQDYRRTYHDRYPHDYEKLYREGEPEWGRPSMPETRVKPKQAEPTPPAEPETQDEIHSLLQLVEQALRERQQAIAELAEEKRRLRAELDALQALERRITDEELRNDCAELLKTKKYRIDAIRRAGVVLEERLRQTIGGSGPERLKQGVDLVDYALMPDSGKLIISEHPAEQEGVRMLFRGAVQFVRNPPSHKKLRYTELEARQAVGLIDYLLSLLRQTKP